MEQRDAVGALAALAHDMRLTVFRALIGAAPEGLTPGMLAATLDVPASTLSFHLAALTQAGLVSPQRDGRQLIYRASIDRMNALLAYLTAHCCGGAECGIVAPPACAVPAAGGRGKTARPTPASGAKAPVAPAPRRVATRKSAR